ncbi:MAG: ATP-binding protein [Acidimicrobiia bacterium]
MSRRTFAWKGRGIRARTTLVATVAVGLVLAGGGVLLVIGTRSALLHAVETTVAARSQDVATQLSSGTTADPIPLVRGISVQVLVDDSVVASTVDIEGQAPIIEPTRLPATSALIQVASLDAAQNDVGEESQEDPDGPFLVSVAVAEIGGVDMTVLAAGSIAGVEGTTQTMVPLLALGIPAVTALVALLVWRLTYRAFRPVEAITRQADAISYSDLHLRIPEPEADDEIRHLSVVLNRMLERVQLSAFRQQRFTSDAGHEMKSPVATLLTMAEVAEKNPEEFEVVELAADFAAQSRRLATLVEDLLLLARTDEQRLDISFERFDLAQCIRGELAGLGPVEVSIDAGHVESIWIRGDQQRIGQVVRNLLDNAIRHAHSLVRIDTRSTVREAVLCVADDGPGVPDEERERIFERFVRLDEARSRDAGGTGLGLSVVRSIVEHHGGSIAVDGDDTLGGAAFTVYLPRWNGASRGPLRAEATQ